MFDPEAYYESELKGKTYRELHLVLFDLHQEFQSLKRKLEDPTIPADDPLVLTKDEVIAEYREKMALAIKAYEEIGYKYEPVKFEENDREFSEALEILGQMEFFMHQPDTEDTRIVYSVIWNTVIKKAFVDDVLIFKDESITRAEFLAALRELHIGEWDASYDGSDVADLGVVWRLKFNLENGERFKYQGRNKAPYNFDKLIEYLTSGLGE